MKIFSLLLFLTASQVCFSQSVFPSLSPKGKVEQNIGSTTITVEYERPAARGRVVFGGLVKYNKLWRTGAGYCTKIRFSKNVVINDKDVPEGSYSVLSIPRADNWTIILNRDTTLYGASSYDSARDVVRINVKAENANRFYESLTFDIDVIPNNAVINISWANTRVSFPVMTGIDRSANDFIERNLLSEKSENPDEYAEGAEYYYFLNRELNRALVLINKAISLKNESWYYRQKIDILEKLKKYQDAIDCANLAISLDQQRADWDAKSKQESEAEYRRRIEGFRSLLMKSR